MDYQRYNTIRNRLIELYQILTQRKYPMVFPRSALLSLTQLENTEHVSLGTFHDGNFYDTPTLQYITIETMIRIIPNLSDPAAMAYRKPKKAVEIYESIQEYLSLWMDVVNYLPEFAFPRVDELYRIESVAQWAYRQYAEEIRLQEFRDANEHVQSEDRLNVEALLKALTGGLNPKVEELSFVSHLDDRLPSHLRSVKTTDEDLFAEWHLGDLIN